MYFIVPMIALSLFMVYLAYNDIKTHKVPNAHVAIVAGASIIPIVSNVLFSDTKWGVVLLSHIGGAIAAFAIMIFAGLITKGGFGGGDIKLMTALGLWFGFYGICAVAVVSTVLYLVYTLFVRALAKKKGLTAPKVIAFVPFILLSFIPVITVIALYLKGVF